MLRSAFGTFGPVLDVIVMKDPQTGRSRGYGFVTYGSQQEADNAISGMNDQELVRFCVPFLFLSGSSRFSRFCKGSGLAIMQSGSAVGLG